MFQICCSIREQDPLKLDPNLQRLLLTENSIIIINLQNQQATGVDTKLVYETGLYGRRNQAVKEILGEVLCSEPEREYYFNAADGTITMNINRTGYPEGVNVSWYTIDPLHYPVFNENDEYLGAVLSSRGFLSMERLAEAVRKAKAKMARYPW